MFRISSKMRLKEIRKSYERQNFNSTIIDILMSHYEIDEYTDTIVYTING